MKLPIITNAKRVLRSWEEGNPVDPEHSVSGEGDELDRHVIPGLLAELRALIRRLRRIVTGRLSLTSKLPLCSDKGLRSLQLMQRTNGSGNGFPLPRRATLLSGAGGNSQQASLETVGLGVSKTLFAVSGCVRSWSVEITAHRNFVSIWPREGMRITGLASSRGLSVNAVNWSVF